MYKIKKKGVDNTGDRQKNRFRNRKKKMGA